MFAVNIINECEIREFDYIIYYYFIF